MIWTSGGPEAGRSTRRFFAAAASAEDAPGGSTLFAAGPGWTPLVAPIASISSDVRSSLTSLTRSSLDFALAFSNDARSSISLACLDFISSVFVFHASSSDLSSFFFFR